MKDSPFEVIHRDIQEFRNKRANRSVPFPESIKERVVALLDQHPVHFVAKQLTLGDGLIYSWKEALGLQEKPQKKRKSPNPFVELSLDIGRPDHNLTQSVVSCIELERADGAKMRIQMTILPEHFNAILSNFFGDYLRC